MNYGWTLNYGWTFELKVNCWIIGELLTFMCNLMNYGWIFQSWVNINCDLLFCSINFKRSVVILPWPWKDHSPFIFNYGWAFELLVTFFIGELLYSICKLWVNFKCKLTFGKMLSKLHLEVNFCSEKTSSTSLDWLGLSSFRYVCGHLLCMQTFKREYL